MKSDDIVITSRIRLARNLDKVSFPHKVSIEKGKEIVAQVEDAFYKSKYSEGFNTAYLWNMDKLSQKACFEKHLISSSMLNNSNKAAFIYNDTGTVSLMINEEDHLRIQCINNGYNLDMALDTANNIDDYLEESLNFAFHERYGFLDRKSVV
mgnify:FL=1